MRVAAALRTVALGELKVTVRGAGVFAIAQVTFLAFGAFFAVTCVALGAALACGARLTLTAPIAITCPSSALARVSPPAQSRTPWP